MSTRKRSRNNNNNSEMNVIWQYPNEGPFFPVFTPKKQKHVVHITYPPEKKTKKTIINPNNSGSPLKTRVSYSINEIKTQQKSIEENMCIDIKKREINKLEKYEQIYNQHRELLDKEKETIDNLLGKIENERTEFREQKTEEIEKFRKKKNNTNNNVYKFRIAKRFEINSFIKKQEREYQKYLQIELNIYRQINQLLNEYSDVRNKITTYYDNECKEEKRNKQNNLNKFKKELQILNQNTNNNNIPSSPPPVNIFSPSPSPSPLPAPDSPGQDAPFLNNFDDLDELLALLSNKFPNKTNA